LRNGDEAETIVAVVAGARCRALADGLGHNLGGPGATTGQDNRIVPDADEWAVIVTSLALAGEIGGRRSNGALGPRGRCGRRGLDNDVVGGLAVCRALLVA
jgi:hypothetical protein